VTWVTQSGWLLSMTLESPTIQNSCQVHDLTPPVIFRSADGELIRTTRKVWSLPNTSTGVDLSSNVSCMTETRGVTHVLSHHDKFVLDSQPNIIRSKKRSLILQGKYGKRSIQPPGSIKNVPQVLAFHPSREWIVLGEGRSLHILVGRDHKRK
jgi:hypothetical protein